MVFVYTAGKGCEPGEDLMRLTYLSQLDVNKCVCVCVSVNALSSVNFQKSRELDRNLNML